MSVNENDKNFKIRFRFPNGEEFEAEGNRDFIEQQRNYFLALIGKRSPASVISLEPAAQRSRTLAPAAPKPADLGAAASAPRADLSLPWPNLSLPPAQRGASAESAAFPALRLWERILKEDGEKGALLLLAGARVLLKQPACSALNLSRALKKSGFDEVRLDRLLAPDIKNGYITSDGSKRSRMYRLTNEGFARSFVLAEKLGSETL